MPCAKTKAGRRFIDLSVDTIDMINHYIENCSIQSEFDLVFPSATGHWQQVENWRKRGFQVACIEAGLIETIEENGKAKEKIKYTPYALRHFYASMLIREKEDLKRIQRLMGHEKIETTFNVYGLLIEAEEIRNNRRPGMLERLNKEECANFVLDTT